MRKKTIRDIDWRGKRALVRVDFNVPIDGNGHTSVNRFHICDNIPFQTSFEGCIEKYKGNRWGPNGCNVCIYDAVAFWYQAAGQTDPYQAYPLSARVDQYMEPSPAQS